MSHCGKTGLEFVDEGEHPLVPSQKLGDLVVGMKRRGVVAAPKESPDSRQGGIGQFAAKIVGTNERMRMSYGTVGFRRELSAATVGLR